MKNKDLRLIILLISALAWFVLYITSVISLLTFYIGLMGCLWGASLMNDKLYEEGLNKEKEKGK